MLKIFYLIIGTLLTLGFLSCGDKQASVTPANLSPVRYDGSASVFEEGSLRYNPVANPVITNMVESSLLVLNNQLVVYGDIGAVGHLDLFQGAAVTEIAHEQRRLNYVFQHAGVYYLLYTQPSGVYLQASTDGFNFNPLNGGLPVLEPVAGTIYQEIYNVGVDIDPSGVWHMLIECAGPPYGTPTVGLGYSQAKLNSNGTIDFMPSRTPHHVVSGGGNPWVGYVDGKGLMAVYGVVNRPEGPFEHEWHIRGGILSGSQVIEANQFVVGAPGVHVADPSLVYFNSAITMSFSYNQDSIYEAFANLSMQDLYTLLQN